MAGALDCCSSSTGFCAGASGVLLSAKGPHRRARIHQLSQRMPGSSTHVRIPRQWTLCSL